MIKALWLLVFQGVLGACDTFYYHEWKARLPALGPLVQSELKLHAARTLIYAVLYGTLPWVAWQGGWAVVLGLLFAAEIVITLWDFRVEVDVRKPLGGLYHGERSTHAIIGIAYGAMLGYLVPVFMEWMSAPTGFAPHQFTVPPVLRWILTVMGGGAVLSALRDGYAAMGMPYGHWPWPKPSGSGY